MTVMKIENNTNFDFKIDRHVLEKRYKEISNLDNPNQL